MLKLIKYELIRKRKLLAMSLAVVILVELALLFTLYKGGGWIGLTMLLTFTTSIGIYLFVLVDCALTYSSDLNKPHGYMLFMTPNNGYKLIASKIIVSFIEIILGTVILFGVLYSNYLYAVHLFSKNLSETAKVFIDLFKGAFSGVIPSLGQFFLILTTMALQWFLTIMTIYFAITLTKTLLSNVKFKGLFSFIFFIGLYILHTNIFGAIIGSLGYFNNMVNSVTNSSFDFDKNLFNFFITTCLIYLTTSSIYLYFSGRLLNKRVDL